MMWRIIEYSHGHPLRNQRIHLPNAYTRAACSQGKLIVGSSLSKVTFESLVFLERLHGDVCGPIYLPCGPIHLPRGPSHYLMVLIDASTRWSHVYILLTQNVSFARLLAQIIKL